jgi:S-adenosylmethionine-diacylglycerol 3-amino-3-carboxypropyl transferase
MNPKIEAAADPNTLLHAQCWEDADTLLAALEVQPGETVVSVGSGGDNTLALLLADPVSVIGIDHNPAQIACCELKTIAYRKLGYGEFLELAGSRTGNRRKELLEECLEETSSDRQAFWNTFRDIASHGIGSLGQFERELSRFRICLLPFAQSPARLRILLQSADPDCRAVFYDKTWNSLRWRVLFRAWFARASSIASGRQQGPTGKDEDDVMKGVLERVRHLLVELDPTENPYLHWFLRGHHGDALPTALRARNRDCIRDRLDRISWRGQSLEGTLGSLPAKSVDRFNLGRLFEPTSEAAYHHLLKAIIRAARPGARLVYWNTLARRTRPETMRERLRPLDDLSTRLRRSDKSLFSQRLVIEEVTG